MLGRLLNQTLREKPPEYLWGDTLPLFQNADCRVCNPECVISDRGRPWASHWSQPPKVFRFRCDAKNVAVLRAAGINVVVAHVPSSWARAVFESDSQD